MVMLQLVKLLYQKNRKILEIFILTQVQCTEHSHYLQLKMVYALKRNFKKNKLENYLII